MRDEQNQFKLEGLKREDHSSIPLVLVQYLNALDYPWPFAPNILANFFL